MDVELKLITRDPDALCFEIFGTANPRPEEKINISEEVRSVQFQEKRAFEDWPTVVGLIASIPTGVLTNLATDAIKDAFRRKDPQGRLKRIEITYMEDGRIREKSLEFEQS
ncbi:hypothetical protein [Streptomyces sp. NPDC050121]|uniref:hypothetical protein n=1 Tax=Streptomyces sp. NPDC050121 TaxID=3365601 RepID=UPI00378F6A73